MGSFGLTAGQCVAQLMYIDWLRSGDDVIIRKVEQHNRENISAMVAVDRYVNELSPC